MLRANDMQGDTINLIDLFRYLWRKKAYYIVTLLVVSVVSVTILLITPNKYTSDASLLAVNNEEIGGLAGLASNFGGLASMAGINLSGSGNSVENEFILSSRDFLLPILKRHNLLHIIVATKAFDFENNEFIYDENIFSNGKWVIEGDEKSLINDEPAEWFIMERVHNVISVSKDELTGIITLKVEHYSPFFAQNLNRLLIDEINAFLKKREKINLDNRLNYLNSQLKNTDNQNLKVVLYSLIEQQLQEKMVLETTEEYAFKVVEAANLPDIKSSPLRAVIMIMIFIATFFLTTFYFMLRFALSSIKEAKP